MSKLLLDRRKREAITLGVICFASICMLRMPVEPALLFGVEWVCVAVGLVGAVAALSSQKRRLRSLFTVLMVAAPVSMAFVDRWVGHPVAYEMSVLTFLSAVALALATTDGRTQSISLVASGFLTLFATVISDSHYAVGIAILWMTVCVWHLVANHWERIDLCAVENVSRSWSVRPASVISAVLLVVVAGLATRGWFGESTRMQGGFMPFSGGSTWSDPGARRGIGTGDAAIAAKDTADSFGAVDSEIFLETQQSTLFDMFSDSIGEPKLKQKWERRQGLTQERVIEAHGHTAKSQKGGDSFALNREVPKQKHLHLDDVTENAVVQWSGSTGIRLAMNRYDTFDGEQWTNQASHRNEKLAPESFGEDVWFFDQRTKSRAMKTRRDQVTHGKLKNLCLDSARLPAPMMTAGIHIKDVDRQDFFAVDNDDSFYMPGREKVPQLTVIHMASLKMMEDELIEKLAGQQAASAPGEVQPPLPNHELISTLARRWSAGEKSSYDKLRSIVSHFRSEFMFDRQTDLTSEQPLDEFLTLKRGGDHWFATAMALMAREIGLQSRLVTGFYVRPAAVDVSAAHSNVRADDVHVWTEIRLRDGVWFEVEPTPGFNPPVYQPSIWLVTSRLVYRYWPVAVLSIALAGVCYLTRLFWLEWALHVLWWASMPLKTYRRLILAIRIVEFRAWLVGRSRPTSAPTRQWLLEDLVQPVDSDAAAKANQNGQTSQRKAAESYCDLADRLCFGPVPRKTATRDQLHAIGNLVAAFPIRKMKQPLMEKEKQHGSRC